MAMPPPPPPPPMAQSRLEEGFRPGDPPPPHEEVPGFMVYMNVINTTTHLLLGAVAFFAFMVTNVAFGSNFPKFNAHVYLTVIGYTILMSQAIFSLNPQTGWANNFKYPQKTMIFWLLQVIGSFLAIIGGIMAVVAVKEINDVTISLPGGLPDITIRGLGHLNSAHAIVGFIAMILTTVSLVGALAHMFNNNIKNNIMLKAIYSCILTATLVMAFIAICLMFHDAREMLLDTNANMAIAFTVLTLLGTIIMIICNMTVGGRILI